LIPLPIQEWASSGYRRLEATPRRGASSARLHSDPAQQRAGVGVAAKDAVAAQGGDPDLAVIQAEFADGAPDGDGTGRQHDGAQLLVDRNIILVGIDYLSIDQSGSAEKAAHHILLSNNITIMESIVLTEVPPGEYFLACGPLKMVGSDGAPCRAVLIKNINWQSE